MSTRRTSSRTMPPATTPDDRENQLISLATKLAERQLRDGTASSQVLTHYLKMASSREALERERLQNENLLLSAKVDQIRSGKRMEELYENALDAMREYSGKQIERYDEDDEY